MAWIESHTDLGKHPKILNLSAMMNWSVREAVGSVHMLWHWCVDYAENGDLRRYNDAVIASVVALNPEEGARFVEALVTCGGEAVSGFIERAPYFRIHDWWDYIGPYLQSKYKHNPAKWKEIRRAYSNGSKNSQRTGITVGKGRFSVLSSSEGGLGETEPLPDWLDSEVWEAYRKHRAAMPRKNRLTPTAERLAISQLRKWHAAGHDPNEIVKASVMNGWQGLFEPKDSRNAKDKNLSQLYATPGRTTEEIYAELQAKKKAGVR